MFHIIDHLILLSKFMFAHKTIHLKYIKKKTLRKHFYDFKSFSVLYKMKIISRNKSFAHCLLIPQTDCLIDWLIDLYLQRAKACMIKSSLINSQRAGRRHIRVGSKQKAKPSTQTPIKVHSSTGRTSSQCKPWRIWDRRKVRWKGKRCIQSLWFVLMV